MNAPNMTVSAVDPDVKWLYRVGGISAIAFGIAYVVIIALYVRMGARPSGAEAWLTYIAGNTTAWRAILGLSALTEFLLVPNALSLSVPLNGINKNPTLVGAAFIGLFGVLVLVLPRTNHAPLIRAPAPARRSPGGRAVASPPRGRLRRARDRPRRETPTPRLLGGPPQRRRIKIGGAGMADKLAAHALPAPTSSRPASGRALRDAKSCWPRSSAARARC